MTPDTSDPSLIRNSWDDPEFTDDADVPSPPRAREAQGNRRGAKGYMCCRHCSEDTVHDVEADGHDGPCQSCDDPGVLLRERAEAAESERDELRAALVEVQQGEASAIEAHDALEVRLRDSMADADRLLAQRDELRAEVERLRATVARVEALLDHTEGARLEPNGYPMRVVRAKDLERALGVRQVDRLRAALAGEVAVDAPTNSEPVECCESGSCEVCRPGRGGWLDHDAPTSSAGGARCHAARDGECSWGACPQLRDGEPKATGRHCPIDRDDEDGDL